MSKFMAFGVCNLLNVMVRFLAGVIVVAIFMVQAAHIAHATSSAINASAAFSDVTAHSAHAEREIVHVHAHIQINDEKPSGQLVPMAGDCMTLSCCFVVDDPARSLVLLFAFRPGKYLNLNSLPSKAYPAMVHERPPRTI